MLTFIAMIYVFILSMLFLCWLIYQLIKNNKKKSSLLNLSHAEKEFLLAEVSFYERLDEADRLQFEEKIAEFISRIRIEWIGVNRDDNDRLLVAASAIIPIWGFRGWKYPNISSVILYPGSFNKDFDVDGIDRQILGMVGSGYMNGQMILSQQALRHGFKEHTLGHNTGIHEFVHLLDKSDGAVDGVPENLLKQPYVLPWLDLVHEEIKNIRKGKSDIDPYGATNRGEFLAVVSEYFFEKPNQMKERHPDLYQMMEQIFRQSPAEN